jgi:hypothetical protein
LKSDKKSLASEKKKKKEIWNFVRSIVNLDIQKPTVDIPKFSCGLNILVLNADRNEIKNFALTDKSTAKILSL